MKAVRVATRASKLALTQTDIVSTMLRKYAPDLEISVVKISTKGDRDKSDFLYKSSSVGFFTTEVEKALLDGRADLAVHSLKDLPTAITEGLIVAATPRRESVADALIAAEGIHSIDDLPARATVGTSSLRRIAQIRHLRRDIACVPLRGNVETRISKVDSGRIDAAIVACAGVNRLGRSSRISAVLDPAQFLTAPGQGALAIQIRTDNPELAELAGKLNDEETRTATDAERHVLAALHGGCSIPLGVHTTINGPAIKIDAVVGDPDGEAFIRCSVTSDVSEAKVAAARLTEQLLDAGAGEILRSIREDQNKPGPGG